MSLYKKQHGNTQKRTWLFNFLVSNLRSVDGEHKNRMQVPDVRLVEHVLLNVNW